MTQTPPTPPPLIAPVVPTANLVAIPAEALTTLTAQPAVKPGVTTTEFWISALGSVALLAVAVWLFLVHRIDQGAFTTLASIGGGGVPGVYALLRTILKSAAPTASLPPLEPGS